MKLGGKEGIFNIIQGHQITDEMLYLTEGDIPVFTGNNEIKGYWNKTIIKKNQLPCITYPTKGNSGVAFIQEKLFDANNTAVLILKEKYKETINLKYISCILPKLFLEMMTSKGGVSYLNKEIVEDIDIFIPNIKLQSKISKIYNEYLNVNNKIIKIKKDIDNIKGKHLSFSDKKDSFNEIFGNIIGYKSRNDFLSEEGIYNIPIAEGDYINVLSGNIDGKIYGKIGLIDGIHYIEDRQILHLVTRGKAGKLTYFCKGNYATNTNSFLMFIKKNKFKELNILSEKDEEIYLKFLVIYLQPYFYEIVSNSDVSVFPFTDVVKKYKFKFYKLSKDIYSLVNIYDKLFALEKRLDDLLDTLSENFNKTLSN